MLVFKKFSDLVEGFKVRFGGVVIVTPRDVGL